MAKIRSNSAVRLKLVPRPKLVADNVVRGVLASVGENFMNFRMVAAREADELRQIAQWAPGVLVTIPYFEADIYDVEGLCRVAGAISSPRCVSSAPNLTLISTTISG